MIFRPAQPITEDDETITAMLEAAEVPTLLASLAYVTGDLSLLREDLKQDPAKLAEPEAGFSPEQKAAIRVLAREALIRYRDSGCRQAPAPDADTLHRIMEFAVGAAVPVSHRPLLEEELSVTGEDLRAPTWNKDAIAPGRDFMVAIIGAGMSGLLAAHRLQQAGVPYVIIEKNDDVGGTWLQNTYPGCRVDITNHVYSYSFAQRTNWPFHFSTQDVLLEYFRECADRFDLREHIRFGTEIDRSVWDEQTGEWVLHGHDSTGPVVVRANMLISAVGQLNRPKLPDIAGLDTFTGPVFHSAEWDHDVDLAGKRVAVIGNGASAVQFVPIVARTAASVDIFQRTPNWLFPIPTYMAPV
ncbi:MAG TPA: NAD(P)/FAD-dependent oxidoreductase, partial [Ilumatobacteraceae bacterium]